MAHTLSRYLKLRNSLKFGIPRRYAVAAYSDSQPVGWHGFTKSKAEVAKGVSEYLRCEDTISTSSLKSDEGTIQPAQV
jgi:hypothetical protein